MVEVNIDRLNFLKTFVNELGVDVENGTMKNRKVHLGERGYYQFTRWDRRKKSYMYHLHEVVAFCGGLNILDKTVNHIDGNKLNNAISNLEVLTMTENMKHAKDSGLILKGEQSTVSKLKEVDVLEIRKKYSEGRGTFQALADEYGVSNSQISRIIHRQLWRHI